MHALKYKYHSIGEAKFLLPRATDSRCVIIPDSAPHRTHASAAAHAPNGPDDILVAIIPREIPLAQPCILAAGHQPPPPTPVAVIT